MTPVSIMRDITVNILIPCTATHHFAPVPPAPPVPIPMLATPLSLQACAIESPTNVWWPPGMLLGQNKFTTTVIHQGMPIALDGHDCGVLIPHVQVTPAPNNMLTLLHIAFSSRKSMFVASKVVMNGKSPACCAMFGWPPSPMMYCADPMSPPLADAVTSYLNTVHVGMTLADFLIGAISIAASMILDKIFSSKSPVDLPSSWRALGEAAMDKVIGAGSLAEFLAKNGLSLATGAARLIFTDGPAALTVGAGCPYLQVQGGAERGATPGPDGSRYTYGGSSQVGNVGSQINTSGATVTTSDTTGSTQRQRGWNDSGPTTTTTDSSPTEGFRTTSTTTDSNGQTTASSDSGGRGGTPSTGAPL